ncbi:MAG TPA: hypothetical protein VGC54_10320 [Planctomycetota bacterium]
MSLRLLFVGEMRLGSRPTGLPRHLAERNIQAKELSPTVAWRNVQNWALENGVDAVVLTGDVVESPEDRFEAFAHLAHGVRRLVRAGIRVVGVAGENDVVALPLLADRVPDFRLLGRGGNWETETIEPRPGEKVELVGWSFPSRQVGSNPLESLGALPDVDHPRFGLLHCDVDGKESGRCAPVPAQALQGAPVDAWFLGHKPQPEVLGIAKPARYLGSLTGLDPAETGAHGPLLVTVGSTGEVVAETIALSPMRWEAETVSVAGIDTSTNYAAEQDLKGRLLAALHRVGERTAPEMGEARAVGCTLILTGEIASSRAVRSLVRDPQLMGLYEEWDGVPFFIRRIDDRSTPELDLVDLAQGADPPALLARRLLALKQGGRASDELLAMADLNLETVSGDPLWSGLQASQRAFETRELLLRAGTLALEELLVQRATIEKETIR